MLTLKLTDKYNRYHEIQYSDDIVAVCVKKEGFDPQHIIIDQMKPVVKKCLNERCALNNTQIANGCVRLDTLGGCRLYNLYGKGDGK